MEIIFIKHMASKTVHKAATLHLYPSHFHWFKTHTVSHLQQNGGSNYTDYLDKII